MEALLDKTDEVVVVHLKGRLDFESADPFRETCLKNLANEKVVFNLKDLNFVGSSGLTTFIQTLEELKKASKKGFKLCGVGTEFKRLFSASEIADVEIYENETQARHALRFQIPSNEIVD